MGLGTASRPIEQSSVNEVPRSAALSTGLGIPMKLYEGATEYWTNGRGKYVCSVVNLYRVHQFVRRVSVLYEKYY